MLDVLIRGAGPVGCALALALRDSNLKIAVQAQGFKAPFRPIALSYASRLILERVGIWDRLQATAIDAVHVSQQGGFGRTWMQARDAGVPALGYVVDYAALGQAMQEALRARGISIASEGEAARCTVHAEGAADDAREKRYAQDAVVALVKTAPPAGSTAFERFTAEGPLALLPYAGSFAIVWSASPAQASALASMEESRFLEILAETAGAHVGRPCAVSARSVQPLALRVRAARVGHRAVYIGNAAQTLHPVAGQGLNLGLRDAWELARILRESPDPGDGRTLARYAAQRRADVAATVGMTDLLAGAFTGSSGTMRALRSIALSALDVLPGARRFFARRMIYGPSALP
jgi:2-octaprenyl-6-methoxyphenol hydroxylase